MRIILNGSVRDIPDDQNATELLRSLGLVNKRLALEINSEIVPRSTFDRHILRSDDQVEIVHAIGGG